MSRISELKFEVPEVTRKCHPEAKPKNLANEKEILRFAQNDSFAVTLAHFRHFSDNLLTTHQLTIHKLLVSVFIVSIFMPAHLYHQ